VISLLKGFFRKIHEINVRYQHPKIHQSRGVKIALFMLRVYLILLVLLLVYKFAITVKGG
jgi:hypothetical protein